MSAFELLKLNLLSPMVLCFALGAVARLMRSDLSLPDSVYTGLSTYLLLAIGMKGGVAIAETPAGQLIGPAIATVLLGVTLPVLTFAGARMGKLSRADAGALAAHYGSVSAVTFIASQTFLKLTDVKFEGFMPALVALMEIPGIIVGLMLARPKAEDGNHATMKESLLEIVTGKSIMLLGGGMVVGALTGHEGFEKVKDFFVTPYQGVLCLFLLDMGLLAAKRLGDLRLAGPFLAVFALIAPVVFGMLGVLAGRASGLSLGGATVLAAMSASASYIAAPAAVRLALPQANPTYYLTASVGITFPFNLALGIPLYYAVATWLYTAYPVG